MSKEGAIYGESGVEDSLASSGSSVVILKEMSLSWAIFEE